MSEDAQQPADAAPFIRLLSIKRFRGIEDLTWLPARGVNVLLGGGDVGKTTILEAIALLLNPTNATTLSDADYWQRRHEDGFEISAVMALPLSCGIVEQRKSVWPWEWGGDGAKLPDLEANDGHPHDPVFCVRVCGTTDFDLQHEICQPDESFDHFPVSVRRNIGVVRLSGDDRNDRDLRLLQGSALDRLLSDRTLRSRLADKPRDRMHFEQFNHFHESFYRAVEATSVTPWSARAMDRALAAIVVALARHLQPNLTPSYAAREIADNSDLQTRIADYLCDRSGDAVVGGQSALRQKIRELFDDWETLVEQQTTAGGTFSYDKRDASGLLHAPLAKELSELSEEYHKFTAGWSMRDVEPAVRLKPKGPDGRPIGNAGDLNL